MSTDRERLRALLAEPGLAPLLPLVAAVWADAELTAAEIEALRRRPAWLQEDAAGVLALWLDPDDPPAPAELLRLRRHLRETAPENAGDLTLAGLGMALARRRDDLGVGGTEIEAALEELQERLGLTSTEATRELLAPTLPPEPAEAPDRTIPAFDVEAMQALLDGPYAGRRRRVRELLDRPELEHRYDMSVAQRREQVMGWLRLLADDGLGELAFPGVTTEVDAGHFFTAFEMLAAFDVGLMTKFGVQFGLFGGSIYHLGSDAQRRRWLPAVATLELPGCFAMSELGHGSNVRELETLATYHAASEEFEIHTPRDAARKEWIGNAALHGRMATVFAQLRTGQDCHGVHAFLVPLRDADGTTLPGVRIEDCGPKMGLDGVDNGRIWFDRVRIPRDHLLDRFGTVAADGTYRSSIPSPGRRFFTMLRTLVGGRIAVAAAGVTVSRTALVHAVRYASRRRQFGPSGKPEVPILDYRIQQLRLMPLLAEAYAYGFAVQELVERVVRTDPEEEGETEALAAGVKALATWSTSRTTATCRESCGGQGYLAVNRLPALLQDSEVFSTYEGDNTVLLQLVAKARLASFRSQLGDSRLLGTVRHLAAQAATAVTELNPLAVRQRSEEHLRAPEFQLAAFRYRENRLVVSLARRLKARIDGGTDPFDALNACQDHALLAARAYVLRWVLERFESAIRRCGRSDLETQLADLRSLFALHEIHRDSGWFQQAGYVEGAKARAIRDQVLSLCADVREQAVPLVGAFAIPPACLGPIGRGELAG